MVASDRRERAEVLKANLFESELVGRGLLPVRSCSFIFRDHSRTNGASILQSRAAGPEKNEEPRSKRIGVLVLSAEMTL